MQNSLSSLLFFDQLLVLTKTDFELLRQLLDLLVLELKLDLGVFELLEYHAALHVQVVPLLFQLGHLGLGLEGLVLQLLVLSDQGRRVAAAGS